MVDRPKFLRSSLFALCGVVALASGCGASKESTYAGGGSGGTTGTGSTGTGLAGTSSLTGSVGLIPVPTFGDGSVTPVSTAVWPPPGFINVTPATTGAYGLGPEITPGSDAGAVSTSSDPGNCGALYAVIRDFKMGSTAGGHPDFNTFSGSDTKIVTKTIGPDNKPGFAPGPMGHSSTTSSQANFDQWYRDVPGVNRTFVLGLHLVQNAGVVTFQADKFFPLDGQGFGNEYQSHNYSFTSEIHTAFTYNGGETFTFIGDDDVFVYIDKQLVINLGGIHNAQTGQVKLDDVATSLALIKGKVYDLAVFQAERHTSESHFRIDTTLAFVDCGQIPASIQ